MSLQPSLQVQQDLSGVELALDFANTASWHASDAPEESLHTYADLLAWAAGAGVLDEAQLQALRLEARCSPTSAAAALRAAVELRECIYRIFAVLAHAGKPLEADLQALKRAYAEALLMARLARSGDVFRPAWRDVATDLESPLWPVVGAAVDLLASPDLARLGQCADERGCGWLFIDRSRNHSRRWCDMRDCGNRAKAARHYERLRGK